MKRILEGPSRRVASVFNEVDINFIELCNHMLKIAYPECTLKNYAEPDTEPVSSVSGDCYLAKEDGTIWGLEALKDHVIHFNGVSWELLPHRISEINVALQSLFFTAGNITFTPPSGLMSDNLQSAMEEICTLLINAGILIP